MRALQAAAVGSTGSFRGPLAEQLGAHLVDEVRHSRHAEETLGGLLEQAFKRTPGRRPPAVADDPGMGRRTAAALIAKIGSLDRFSSPETLVSYFGIFPEENTSGVDKWGQSVPAGSRHRAAEGNDLVRGLLWMACQSAIRFDPPVRGGIPGSVPAANAATYLPEFVMTTGSPPSYGHHGVGGAQVDPDDLAHVVSSPSALTG